MAAELTIIAIVALPAAFEPVSWNTASDGPSNEHQQHASVADQEQLPPANPVDEQGAGESHDEV